MKFVSPYVVRSLFFITAVVLGVFGVASFMRTDVGDNMKMMYNIYAVLMLGDAAAMLIFGLYIHKGQAMFWLAVSVLGLNIVLTIFDQFGLVDLLFILLNIVTLASLVFLRKEFLPQ